MGTLPQDLTGRQFGRWTVVGPGPIRGKNRLWRCVCECGTERYVLGFTLKSGASSNCGCFRSVPDIADGKHRMTKTPEYIAWRSMMDRCYRHAFIGYASYGGRGIVVCDRWRASFVNFYSDMGPRPSPEHSLDRIDNDGPYSPENCRWATRAEQGRNRRTNRPLTHDGETMCVSEWAERFGLSRNTLQRRLDRGWSFERATSEPPQPQRNKSTAKR